MESYLYGYLFSLYNWIWSAFNVKTLYLNLYFNSHKKHFEIYFKNLQIVRSSLSMVLPDSFSNSEQSKFRKNQNCEDDLVFDSRLVGRP